MMHYYKKNIGDYHKKAGRLSMLEHGAYTLLLDACYDRERFPTMDDAMDWAWARTDAEKDAVKFVLSKFFTLSDGVYVQERVAEEIEKYHSTATTNARIAKEREENRRNKPKPYTKRARIVNEPSPDSHEAPPNQEPLTINQEPLTNNQIDSVAYATDGKPPKVTDPKIIIFSIGVGMLVEAGISEKQSRSFLGGLVKTHGEGDVINKLRECARERPLQPLTWLAAALPPPKQPTNKQELLERQNQQVADEWVAEMQAKMKQGVNDAGQ